MYILSRILCRYWLQYAKNNFTISETWRIRCDDVDDRNGWVNACGHVGERLGKARRTSATCYHQRPAWSSHGLTQLRSGPSQDWPEQRPHGVRIDLIATKIIKHLSLTPLTRVLVIYYNGICMLTYLQLSLLWQLWPFLVTLAIINPNQTKQSEKVPVGYML